MWTGTTQAQARAPFSRACACAVAVHTWLCLCEANKGRLRTDKDNYGERMTTKDRKSYTSNYYSRNCAIERGPVPQAECYDRGPMPCIHELEGRFAADYPLPVQDFVFRLQRPAVVLRCAPFVSRLLQLLRLHLHLQRQTEHTGSTKTGAIISSIFTFSAADLYGL